MTKETFVKKWLPYFIPKGDREEIEHYKKLIDADLDKLIASSTSLPTECPSIYDLMVTLDDKRLLSMSNLSPAVYSISKKNTAEALLKKYIIFDKDMAKQFRYKDYAGSIRYSDEDKCYYGRIIGVSDLVSYEGQTEEELEKSFQEAVDEYEETLKEIGR